MVDELGGTSVARVPAWKKREQQRKNNKPPSALNVNDELGGTRPRRNRNDELGGTRSLRNNGDELGGTKTGGKAKLPAWKIREQMKKESSLNSSLNSSLDISCNFNDSSSTCTTTESSDSSVVSRSSASSNFSSHPTRTIRSVSRVPGPDPSLPPAFRAEFEKQRRRKKSSDSFISLSSVHSRTTAASKADSFGSDSFGSLDSDECSFDGEDSFASLDSDADEDDDAYRESRNQLARLEIEKRSQESKRPGGSRFKKKKKPWGSAHL